MIEEYFRRAMVISQGDALVFLQKPVSAVMLAIAAVMLVLTLLPAIARKREEIFVPDDR